MCCSEFRWRIILQQFHAPQLLVGTPSALSSPAAFTRFLLFPLIFFTPLQFSSVKFANRNAAWNLTFSVSGNQIDVAICRYGWLFRWFSFVSMISHPHPFTFVFIHFFFLSFLIDKENPNFEICSLGFEKAIGCYNAAVQVSLNLNLEFQNFKISG